MTTDPTIARHIQAHGWHCLHIAPSDDSEDPFSYSVGFWATHGVPEVLVFGLPEAQAHALLSACAARLAAGGTIRPDSQDDSILSGGYSVTFKPVRADQFEEYLGTAMRYYGDENFQAVVMFLPDPDRRFPWDDGYAGPSAREAVRIV